MLLLKHKALTLDTEKTEMRCAIWYHLYNLKNVKNTHGGVTLLHACFSRFLNCTSGTKSRNGSHIQELRQLQECDKIYNVNPETL